MPRKEIDYSKTIIYKICCKDPSIKDEYVGHTTDFTSRKYSHKNRCVNDNNEKHNFYVYKFIRDNGDWDNWSMIEIEKYPCHNNNEARKRERYWIESLKPTLNKKSSFTTKQEYNDKRVLYNKARLEKKCKCECGSIVGNHHKSRHEKTKKHQDFILNKNIFIFNSIDSVSV